jgi:hypothetical protein
MPAVIQHGDAHGPELGFPSLGEGSIDNQRCTFKREFHFLFLPFLLIACTELKR